MDMDRYQRRKILLSISKKNQRPGTGSNLHSLMEKGSAMEILKFSFTTKYILVGGRACNCYMPPRYTEDYDLLVHPDDEQRMITELTNCGWDLQGALSIGGTQWIKNNVELDVLLGNFPWINICLNSTKKDKVGNPIIDLPYLVCMKLISARIKDTADLSRMLGAANDFTLKRVKKIVTTYHPEHLEDLETIIQLGKLEYLEE